MSILTPSPIYQLEKAFQSLLQASLPSLLNGNVLISDNNQRILHPCVKITTENQEEVVTPFSGVFKASVRLTYETKLTDDQQTPSNAETQFSEVMQALYYTDPQAQSICARLNSYSLAYVYGVVIKGVSQSIESTQKLWVKSILMDVFYMPSISF